MVEVMYIHEYRYVDDVFEVFLVINFFMLEGVAIYDVFLTQYLKNSIESPKVSL